VPEVRELEKQLKIAAKTGKYLVGRREVLSGVKGTKLLVWSASADIPQKILDECKTLSVPAVKFNGNPVELGHACGIPFRVSVIALKAAGDADLSAFSNSIDYMSSSKLVSIPKTEEVKEEAPEKEAKKAEKAPTKRKPRKKAEPEKEEKTEEKKAKTSAAPKKATRKKKTSEEEK
jgi:large subunit ribosomal protein L30e